MIAYFFYCKNNNFIFICQSIIFIINKKEMMEEDMKTEATQVTGCRKCNQTSGKTQKFVFIAGGLVFALSIYGLVSLIYDIKSLF
jgi:hypothetical protein